MASEVKIISYSQTSYGYMGAATGSAPCKQGSIKIKLYIVFVIKGYLIANGKRAATAGTVNINDSYNSSACEPLVTKIVFAAKRKTNPTQIVAGI